MRRNPAAFAIPVGGGIAGAFDITYAILFSYLYRGTAPVRLLQSVASGLIGARAFEGGTATALLGLGLHFTIAFIWASIYYVVSRQFDRLTHKAVSSGIIYGIIIYAVMNLVVVPLSATARRTSFPLIVFATGITVHMFLIGLPIALATRKATRPRS